jgi:hypothetical protein
MIDEPFGIVAGKISHHPPLKFPSCGLLHFHLHDQNNLTIKLNLFYCIKNCFACSSIIFFTQTKTASPQTRETKTGYPADGCQNIEYFPLFFIRSPWCLFPFSINKIHTFRPLDCSRKLPLTITGGGDCGGQPAIQISAANKQQQTLAGPPAGFGDQYPQEWNGIVWKSAATAAAA